MSDQRAAQGRSFFFNLDSRFQHKLDLSEIGLLVAAAVMVILGHEPCPTKIENVLRTIFKDPSAKRDRHSDLFCLRCGQRFEAKAKSSEKYFYVGPDLLEQYAAEDAIIVFTFPSKIVAVRARELYARRHLARPGRNSDGEPFLDFSGLKIPRVRVIRRRKQCSPGRKKLKPKSN